MLLPFTTAIRRSRSSSCTLPPYNPFSISLFVKHSFPNALLIQHIHKRLIRRLVMGRIHVAFIHDHQLAVLLHHHCVAVHGYTHITHLHPPTLICHFHHPLLLRVFLLHLMTHHPPLSPANLPNLRIADRCASHLHSIPTRLALSDCCRSLAHILHKTRILILLLPITPISVNHGIDRFLLQS